MPFNLFRKKKEDEIEEQAQPEVVEQASPQQEPEEPTQETETVEAETETSEPAETPKEEPTAEPAVVAPEAPQPEPEPAPSVEPAPKVEAEVTSKMYLKAMPLRELDDVETIKKDVKDGNILILRVTPLASKSIEDVKKAVNDLFEFTEANGGDIARLGEERVVICPKNVRVWREKKPSAKEPISKQSLPTAA
ncbi:MAG: cell division protein SepF [Candidatus Bathyarchaeota archaeon]|nr:cell division protein SepF [Candidatus Bathyarchaeota archaeon]